MGILRRSPTLSSWGWGGILLNQQLDLPQSLPDGTSISVVTGAESIQSLPVTAAAKASPSPVGLSNGLPSNLSGSPYSGRCVAVHARKASGAYVMFAAAGPSAFAPDSVAMTYAYWCDRSYSGNQTGAAQAQLHNVFLLAHAASIQQAGYGGMVYSLPTAALRAQMESKVFTVPVTDADQVLTALGIPLSVPSSTPGVPWAVSSAAS